MPSMSKTSFYIYYDGPALDENKMDIRELAPALMSLGDLFDNANRVINNDTARIAVNVKSGFKKGSFGIEIETTQTLLATATTLFTNLTIQDAANIAQILGFLNDSGIGLIQLIKLIAGRKIEKIEPISKDNIEIHIKGDSNNAITVNKNTYNLYADHPTRDAFKKTIAPLQQNGIDEFKVFSGENETAKVTKKDVVAFDLPEMYPQLLEVKEEATWISIHTLQFNQTKWRFSDGNNSFWAEIRDQKFIEEVLKDERSFSKGDALNVKIKKTVYQDGNGVKTDYEILELIEHKKSLRQIPLGI